MTSTSRGLRRTSGGGRFESARRLLRILDLVSRGEATTARELARELGVGLSTGYYLLNILLEEGFLERLPSRRGYALGGAVTALSERRGVVGVGGDLDSALAPVLDELAHRSQRYAYLGVLSDGEVAVSRVASPPTRPSMGIVRGFHGASHALALGKVLLAHASGADDYASSVGLEVFTPKTIIRPDRFRLHLERVRERGFATDVEEFAGNLCCVAAPIVGRGGEVEGAVGVSTSLRRFADEAHRLVDLVRWAAGEASALLEGTAGEGTPVAGPLEGVAAALKERSRAG